MATQLPYASRPWVAGADACPAGWIVVLEHTGTGAHRHRIVEHTADLLRLPEQPACIGIDMIIGLPAEARSGGRACDRAARTLLGWPRSSSIFSPPCRAALEADSYEAATAANRASHPDRVGLTKQAFHLFPKIRALDTLITSARQHRICEVHPECSFYVLNGNAPVDPSKHTDHGIQHRIHLLQNAGFDGVPDACSAYPRRQVKRDDMLDTHAACYTARRMHQGTAARLPQTEPVPVDPTGLRMEIWR